MKNARRYNQSQQKANQISKLEQSRQSFYWYLVAQSKFKKILYMKQGTVAKILGYCRETINRAARDLHALGYIIKRNRGVKISCIYSFDFPVSKSKCHTINEYSVVNSIPSLSSPRNLGLKPVVTHGEGLPKNSARALGSVKVLETLLSEEDNHLLMMSALDSGCAYCETAYWMAQTPHILCECNPSERLNIYFDHFILL